MKQNRGLVWAIVVTYHPELDKLRLLLDSLMGRAILHNVGLDELIVDSAEAYVDKAVSLASDRIHLLQLRENLRERMESSPLCDPVRFARGLEVAFRQMWQRWCKRLTVRL